MIIGGDNMGIADNVKDIKRRIHGAAKRAGRNPDAVKLIAVTKTVGVPEIRELLACGVNNIGENRLQVAMPKIEELADMGINWHFIGSLQSNKVKKIIEHFECIHSVDSVRCAEEIQKRAEAVGKQVKVLLEVNVSGESSKHGLSPNKLFEVLESCNDLDNVIVQGLMTMAPLTDDFETARPYFQKLKQLCKKYGLTECSMGMTDDFEVAVEEGATMVRIGRALFI
ncbi:MAG: YggS family pyridoxal phosphate-dependent enzyme [Candidatus Margulisiibacteriota bacterium]